MTRFCAAEWKSRIVLLLLVTSLTSLEVELEDFFAGRSAHRLHCGGVITNISGEFDILHVRLVLYRCVMFRLFFVMSELRTLEISTCAHLSYA